MADTRISHPTASPMLVVAKVPVAVLTTAWTGDAMATNTLRPTSPMSPSASPPAAVGSEWWTVLILLLAAVLTALDLAGAGGAPYPLSFAGHAPLLIVLVAVFIDLTHDAARHRSNDRQLTTAPSSSRTLTR